MFKLAALIGLTVTLGACHKDVVELNGQQVYRKIWQDTVASVSHRAAIEMSCPVSAITVDLVRKEGRYPVEVFAEGCGQRALYARMLRRSGPMGRRTDRNSDWVSTR